MTEQVYPRVSVPSPRGAWCAKLNNQPKSNWRVMLKLADGSLRESDPPSPRFDKNGVGDPYFAAKEWMIDNVHPDHNPVLVWQEEIVDPFRS